MRTIEVPTSCVVLEAPEYPNDVEWTLCELDRPCLSLDNAKSLAKYLAAVQRYHKSIEDTCK